MSGNSRTGKRLRLMAPNKTSARLIMVANTGRWILISGSFIDTIGKWLLTQQEQV